MRSIGLVAETKDGERRVALDPSAVAALVAAGSSVLVESGAGARAGFPDDSYRRAGAHIVPSPDDAWGADIVVKVKEPLPGEWRWFRPGLTLFAYLHLAASPELADALASNGVDAVAFETVTDATGLPLLAPMSEIAGRAAAIVGAFHLAGGSGVLLGGAAGVRPARVVVVGMGVAGSVAARGARGLDAEVTGVDVDLARLRALHVEGAVTATLASSESALDDVIPEADLVIGAALVAGARAPTVVRAEHVKAMRPGSVVVDLAIDQGGCIETARPTSLSDPVYEIDGVIHYCVTNVPGQYPQTATRALSAAVAPRLRCLADDPEHPMLRGGWNVRDGRISHPVVAAALAQHTP
ncbi:MAG: alanine dehydrogenase [Actinobacteria bacterium]|nr:alanine dehydrogenase [Actinomycetota bacterium]